MSSSNWIRIGGLAAVVGGVLFVIAELLYLVVGLPPPSRTSPPALPSSRACCSPWVGCWWWGADWAVRGPEGRPGRSGGGGVHRRLRRLRARSWQLMVRRVLLAGTGRGSSCTGRDRPPDPRFGREHSSVHAPDYRLAAARVGLPTLPVLPALGRLAADGRRGDRVPPVPVQHGPLRRGGGLDRILPPVRPGRRRSDAC